jgi:heme/copper-type cytochrome/quinol oxidase subunit 3
VSGVGTTAPDGGATAAEPLVSPVAALEHPAALAREVPSGRRPGWWGMVLALVADASTFASMLAAYYYVEFVDHTPSWPPPGEPLPKLAKASIVTGVLVASAIPMWFADRGLRAGSRARFLLGGLLVALCGAAFVAITFWEYADELPTTYPSKDTYASLFYAITGFHVLHIILGTLAMLMFLVAAAIGRMGRGHHIVARVFALFWYTSVVIWVLLYGALYWSVRL